MLLPNNMNHIYNKILFMIISIFLVLSTVTFSWLPLIGILPILLILLFFKLLSIRFYWIHYFFITVSMGVIIYTLSNQIIYIELVRNILIFLLIPVVYLIFIDLKYINTYNLLYYIFISSLFVIFFILIINVPQDFALFFGERRGFVAKEFLIFGREYPFSLGVTHLNIYVTYVMTFLLMTLMYNPKKINYKIIYIMLFVIISIAILTQSRSPLLFLLIIFLIYRQYIYTKRKNKMTYLIIRLLFLVLFVLFVLLIFSVYYEQISNSDRLNDVSRFIFYIKGYEHMLAEPWGNSLLYTDVTMPLLNYHNTFLSFGNRIAYMFFISSILYIGYTTYIISRIEDIKIRYSLYLLIYFCFHNFMIEDVIKFDYFAIILFFALFPIAKNSQKGL